MSQGRDIPCLDMKEQAFEDGKRASLAGRMDAESGNRLEHAGWSARYAHGGGERVGRRDGLAIGERSRDSAGLD